MELVEEDHGSAVLQRTDDGESEFSPGEAVFYREPPVARRVKGDVAVDGPSYR
jgi:hypothetical protein